MTELSLLPAAERLMRYRELAAKARRSAQSTPPTVHRSYLVIAASWDALAANLETTLKHPKTPWVADMTEVLARTD